MQEVSKEKIKQIGEKLRKKCLENHGQIVDEEYTLSKQMIKKLGEESVPAYLVKADIGKKAWCTTNHVWVYVDGTHIRNMNSVPVFIDLTIDQYCERNAYEHKVDISLGDDLPAVGIFTPNDEKHKWYRRHGVPELYPSFKETVQEEYSSTDMSINDLADKYDVSRPVIEQFLSELKN